MACSRILQKIAKHSPVEWERKGSHAPKCRIPCRPSAAFPLLLALALSAYALLSGAQMALYAIAQQQKSGRAFAFSPERLEKRETSRRAGIASFIAVSCAAFALIWAAFTNDFSVDYVLHHTNRDLAPIYKFSALWSGQEGSLVLWAWLLTGYGFVLRLRHKTDVTLYAYASTIIAAIQVFFLLLLIIAAPPFAIVPGGCGPGGRLRPQRPCSATPRWSSIRRCSISAMWASPYPSPSRSVR